MKLPTLEPEWINGHYHCKKCGGEMDCWKNCYWRVELGVSRIGGCLRCGIIMVEHEYGDPDWYKIRL